MDTVEILGYIGLSIAVVVGIFAISSQSLFNVIALIPGHYILVLFGRITGSHVSAKSDSAGELSITVGMVFWAIIFGAGYVAYHVLR
jgi:hypothetical protein